MTKIIAKNVEHRYSPRVPNRTEPREFDRYSIYIANNHCKVDLWSVYKKGEEILHTILGDIEFAFPEALKFIPDNRVEDPVSGQKVNPDFLKLLQNRPDLRERFDRTGSIYSDM